MLVGISSAHVSSSRSYDTRRDDRDHAIKIHPTDRVQTMTGEDGHKLDVEAGGRRHSFRKYATENEDMNGVPYTEDRVSVLSGNSFRQRGGSISASETPKLPWYKGVTCHDIRAIMPTVLILLGGLLIMIFVIPYAFSTVIKQLQAEEVLEQQRLAEDNTTDVSTTTPTSYSFQPSLDPGLSPSNLHLTSSSSTLPPIESDT